MNVLQLVLTLVLVAGGLFVYDSFVAERPAPVAPEPMRMESPAAPPSGAEPPLRVELRGAGLDALLQRVEALEARLDELAASEVAASRPTPEEGGTTPPSTFRPEDLVEGEEPRFDERDLAWFRVMKEEVDRRQREERFQQMVANQLDRTGVSLAPDQRQEVIRATLKYREGIRGAYRQEGFSQKPPEERAEALQLLRAEYEQTLYTLIPAADAETILQQMGRFPGMSGRQFGPSRGR